MNKTYTYIFFVSMLLVVFSCKPKQQVQTILVPPIDTAIVVEEKKPEPPIEIKKPEKVELNFSLFMPFDFAENLKEDTTYLQQIEITSNSIPWIQFYEGAKLAADSFSNENLKIALHTFDSGVDSGVVASYVKGIRIYGSKILFAVTPQWTYNQLSVSAVKNKILVFYPQASIQNTANSVIMTTGNAVLISEMGQWIASNFANDNIIILSRTTKNEKELGNAFTFQIDSLRGATTKCKSVDFTTKKIAGLFSALDKTKRNLILISSSDEAFISPVITQLAEKSTEYQMTLCGLPTWENFESVDVKILQLLNTHIFSATWIDFTNEEVIAFEKSFIETYKAEPLYSAFQGFYSIKALVQNGNNSIDYLIIPENPQFKNQFFDFRKQPSQNSFINHHISILKYDDYKLVKVN